MMRLYKSTLLITLSIFFLYASVPIYVGGFSNISEGLILSFRIALFLTGTIVGLGNGFLHYRRQTTSIKEFVFTKPLNTRDMSIARMLATMNIMKKPFVVFLGLLLMITVFFMIAYFTKASSGVLDPVNVFPVSYYTSSWVNVFAIPALIITVLYATWCTTWAFHSLGILIIFFSLGSGMTSAYAGLYGLSDQSNIEEHFVYLSAGLSLCLIAGVWVYSIYKEVIVTNKYLLGLFPILCLCLVITLGDLGPGINGEAIFLTLCVAALSYLPFASVPAVIHWARHR